MDLPTDPDARSMALRMLGWELISFGVPERRLHFGRRADGKETFSTDTAAEAWEWMAETEAGKYDRSI